MMEQLELIDFYLPWFFPALCFVLGAMVGSFLNVCIYRIPANKSIVSPGSHCYACQKPIAFYDNVPILSWFILGGKARCCGAPFSFRYAFIELLTGLLFLACYLLRGPELVVPGMVFIAILICATFTDLDGFIIPEVFTVGGFIAGVLLAVAFPALHGFADCEIGWVGATRAGIIAAAGGIIGSGFILWIAMLAEAALRKQAMGFGDVVFLGMIGTFCGWEGAVFSLFGGALIGVFIGIPLMLVGALKSTTVEDLNKNDLVATGTASANDPVANPSNQNMPALQSPAADKCPANADVKEDGNLPTQGKEAKGIRGLAVPFGPMLAIGGLIYFLWAHRFVDAYIAEFSLILFSDAAF